MLLLVYIQGLRHYVCKGLCTFAYTMMPVPDCDKITGKCQITFY